MKIKELMYPPVIVAPNTSAFELAKIMEDQGMGVVLVDRGNNKYGIVTERDVLFKVVAEDRDFIKTKAKDIMTEDLQTIEPEKHVMDACQRFSVHNIRRLLIKEDDKIVGIVSNKDTARCNIFMYDEYVQLLSESDEGHAEKLHRNVKDVMRDVAKVEPDVSVLDASKAMKKVMVGEAVTRLKDGRHAIITEIDVLYKVVAKGHHPGDVRVEEVCTPLHTTVDANKTIREASGIFNMRNIRRLPVVDGDEVIGIITEKNISKYCVFAYNKTMKALEEIDPESARSFREFEDKRMGIFVKSTLKKDE